MFWSVPQSVGWPIQNLSLPSAAHWMSCVPHCRPDPPICSYSSVRQFHLYTKPVSDSWSVARASCLVVVLEAAHVRGRVGPHALRRGHRVELARQAHDDLPRRVRDARAAPARAAVGLVHVERDVALARGLADRARDERRVVLDLEAARQVLVQRLQPRLRARHLLRRVRDVRLLAQPLDHVGEREERRERHLDVLLLGRAARRRAARRGPAVAWQPQVVRPAGHRLERVRVVERVDAARRR